MVVGCLGGIAFFSIEAKAARAELGAQAVSLTVSEHPGRAVTLHAECLIPRSKPAVWRVLSDYDRPAEFVPFLTESRIIREEPGVKILRQKGRATLRIFHRHFEVTFRVTETDASRIRFKAIEGDFQRFIGSWHLEERSGGTFVRHEVELQPKFYRPTWIMCMVERYVMLKSMDAVIARYLAASP